jgi:hypothetical protein
MSRARMAQGVVAWLGTEPRFPATHQRRSPVMTYAWKTRDQYLRRSEEAAGRHGPVVAPPKLA